MPFRIHREKSFAVVSFAGFTFQTSNSFADALQRYQTRKHARIRKLLYSNRIKRVAIKNLQFNLASAEQKIRQLDASRKGFWRRRNQG